MKTVLVFSPKNGMTAELAMAIGYMEEIGYQVKRLKVLSDNKELLLRKLSNMSPQPDYVFVNYFQEEGDDEAIAEIDAMAAKGNEAFSEVYLRAKDLFDAAKTSFLYEPPVIMFLPKVSNIFPDHFLTIKAGDSLLKSKQTFLDFCQKEADSLEYTQDFVKDIIREEEGAENVPTQADYKLLFNSNAIYC